MKVFPLIQSILLSLAWTLSLLAGEPAHSVVLKNREYRVVQVVVTVDGTPIFQHQLDAAVHQEIDPTRLAQLAPEQRQSALEQAEKAVLKELVGRVLLVNAARREGLQIPEEALQTRLQAIAKRDGKSVDDFLAQQGLDKEPFLKEIRESLLIERLIDAKTKDLPEPSEEDASKYYNANLSEFQQSENVRIRIISVSTRGLTNPLKIDAKRQHLEEVRKRLLENPLTDFAKMAKEESESASAVRGGSVGPFGRGQHAVEPEVEEASFSQKPGEIGQVIETQSGFHLVKVEERNPPRTLGFDEVKKYVSTYLRQRQRHEVMRGLIQQWASAAKIERVKQKPDPPGKTESKAPSEKPAP